VSAVNNTNTTNESYLPAGLPIPVPEGDGLSAPFWNGLRENRVMVQHCKACGTWQHGPEWICHGCHAIDPEWDEVAPRARIYSWERVWHPVHPSLNNHGPYLVVVVEIDGAPGVRMLGNLLGDPMEEVRIGAEVEGVFEHHPQADPPFTLLQWRYAK
jgi:uncharacterized OB-fold protein